MALKRADLLSGGWCLAAETVQSTALAFQSVDDVHGGDRLALGMLGVGNGIPDDILEEYFQDTAGLLVDESGDTLDSTTTCQTANCRLRYTLDVIAKDLAMTLGSPFAQTLSAFTATRHLRRINRLTQQQIEENE